MKGKARCPCLASGRSYAAAWSSRLSFIVNLRLHCFNLSRSNLRHPNPGYPRSAELLLDCRNDGMTGKGYGKGTAA
jgi:hypothetical protein